MSSSIIPFVGTPCIVSRPDITLRCKYCNLLDDEEYLFVIEPFIKDTDGDITEHQIGDSDIVLTNKSVFHSVHTKCLLEYNAMLDEMLLKRISLTKRDTTEPHEVIEKLVHSHVYLEKIIRKYTHIEDVKLYCVNIIETEDGNPCYRIKVPAAPDPTAILDKSFWSTRMYQHLFSIMYYVDVEVVLRNHKETTNFTTLTNQIKKAFSELRTQLDGVYVWWHELKHTSKDRRTFRIVFLHRPELNEVSLRDFILQPGTTWNDLLISSKNDKNSIGNRIYEFHHVANRLTLEAMTFVVARFEQSHDYNVRMVNMVDQVFTETRVLRSTIVGQTDIVAVINASIKQDKDSVRCFVIEDYPHPTIIPYTGTYDDFLPLSFTNPQRMNRDLHGLLHNHLQLIGIESLISLTNIINELTT